MKMKRLAPSILLVLMILDACSVLEDRTGCPSLLILNTEEIKESIKPHMIFIWAERELDLYEKILPEEYPHEWTAQVRRGNITVSAVLGIEKTELNDGKVTISRGQESDRLWTHHSRVDSRDEYCFDTLRMHKQFCILTLDMHDYPEESYDWNAGAVTPEILGDSCGYDIVQAAPVEGPFLAFPRYVGGGLFQVILPRQMSDDDLILKVVKDGSTLGSIDVGSILRSGGYDWEDEDLDDAFILIRNNNSITIGDESGGEFTIKEWEFGGYGIPGW